MLVKELIEILKEYPEDMLVCVDGYEGGYSDIKRGCVYLQGVDLDVNVEDYYGYMKLAVKTTNQACLL